MAAAALPDLEPALVAVPLGDRLAAHLGDEPLVVRVKAAEYREAMVKDMRLVARLRIEHTYGIPPR